MKMIQIKSEAIKLRSEGRTYREIEMMLGVRVPHSTLSSWCKEVKLPRSYYKRVEMLMVENAREARKKSLKVREEKRQIFLRELYNKNVSLGQLVRDRQVAKIALATLYLGEGAKWKGHRGLMLGSSDPTIILLYIKLLDICFGITIDKLRCRISYRHDQNIKELEKYWSDVTGIRLGKFYQTKPDPRTMGKRTLKEGYRGVCVIMCRGTEIQLELEQIARILAQNKGR